MPHTVHYPEQPSQGHVTPPPSQDAPARFVLCCVAKTDNIRILPVFHDEFTQRLIEEGKMVSKSKAHCRRMLQALQQTRAGIFDQLENCQHTLPEYIAISSETSATLIHRVPPEKEEMNSEALCGIQRLLPSFLVSHDKKYNRWLFHFSPASSPSLSGSIKDVTA